MTAPSVTVIVAVRNGSNFIAQCLQSITEQTLAPDEILVIDGASTDNTVEIANGFDLVRVVPQRNLGIADAYNQGVADATGEIIGWLSHDDTWEPRKLEMQVGGLVANPTWRYVVCRRRYHLEPGCEPPPGFRTELLEKDPPVSFCMETFVSWASVFDEVGGFDDRFAVANDVDWFARAKDQGLAYGVIDEPLVNRRVHSSNSSLGDFDNSNQLLGLLRESIQRKKTPPPA